MGTDYMREKVIQFIKEQQLIKQDSTVLVGVSGGPDSLALLHFLSSLKQTYHLRLIVVSIDHMLRGEASKADLAYVQSVCVEWQLEFVSIQVDVNAYKIENKVGTQIAARTLRYAAFAQQMEKYQADFLALGHHGDDQVETMIMSLTRTTNLSALTGIPVKRSFSHGQIIRPFLGVTKKEIETYCGTHQLQPRIDASNQEAYYTRNDIRLNVVPKLKRNNQKIQHTIQLLSKSLQEDEAYITKAAEKAMREFVYFNEADKIVTFSIKKFNEHSVSLQRRIYRLILNYLYKELPDQLTYIHEELFLTLFGVGTSNKTIDFPNELILERSYDQAIIYYQQQAKFAEQLHILIPEVPSTITLPNGATLTAKYADTRMTELPNTYFFSQGQVTFPLHIRNRKQGDRMSWRGLQGTKKLKDVFIDEKVPRKKRDEMYVITDDNDEIIWVIDLKKGKLTSQDATRPFVLLEYHP